MYLPEEMQKSTEDMGMDDFLKQIAMAQYARNMRIEDIEIGFLKAMSKILPES